MSDELKTDDLLSLTKEQNRLIKRLTRIIAVQAVFVVAPVVIMLVMFLFAP